MSAEPYIIKWCSEMDGNDDEVKSVVVELARGRNGRYDWKWKRQLSGSCVLCRDKTCIWHSDSDSQTHICVSRCFVHLPSLFSYSLDVSFVWYEMKYDKLDRAYHKKLRILKKLRIPGRSASMIILASYSWPQLKIIIQKINNWNNYEWFIW